MLIITPKIVANIARLAQQITNHEWISNISSDRSQAAVITTTYRDEIKKWSGNKPVSASRLAVAYLSEIIRLHDKNTGQSLGHAPLRDILADTDVLMSRINAHQKILEIKQTARRDYDTFRMFVDANTTSDGGTSYPCSCYHCPQHSS